MTAEVDPSGQAVSTGSVQDPSRSQSALYRGEVFHRRLRPTEHVLRYRVFSILLDIDELPALHGRLRLFSYNRWNLVSFRDSDVGEHRPETLRGYVERKLTEAGMEQRPERIQLSCYPRILGYSFNPLSLFYCSDAEGRLIAVIHEVHNTFGERHCYVLPVEHREQPDSAAAFTQWIHQECDKALFVSPFAHMNMRYHFRLNQPADRQVLVIRASDPDGLLITASYTATRYVLNDSSLLMACGRMPLVTVKVIVGIHWEALKLWVKRVPLFSHQPKRIV